MIRKIQQLITRGGQIKPSNKTGDPTKRVTGAGGVIHHPPLKKRGNTESYQSVISDGMTGQLENLIN